MTPITLAYLMPWFALDSKHMQNRGLCCGNFRNELLKSSDSIVWV